VRVLSARDVVDGEVPELICRRGLDPFTDPAPVRVLVRDVVADHSERLLTSALPPIGDPESVVRDVPDRVAGFGPLQRYLDDPEVEEIRSSSTAGRLAVPVEEVARGIAARKDIALMPPNDRADLQT
jgi:hypothetical protein